MFDFIVVGSGVSGGRIAFELTKRGAKCLLLEAGRAYTAHTFPKTELDTSSQLFWGGGLELSNSGKLGFLRGKVLGGGSIVNQALLNKFDDLAWDDWKSRSGGVEYFNSDSMRPYYETIEKSIKASVIPVPHYNKNALIFTKALNKMGLGWEPVYRAQGDCKLDQGTDCIVCLGGCPRNSKQSSLITTIKWARELGLEVRSEFQVMRLDYGTDHVTVHGVHQGEATQAVAKKVVLAGGAFGNAELLFRSGFAAKLPALGKAFSCHPQFMTFAFFNEPVNAHKGAFQSVESADKTLRAKGIKLENVYAGPVGISILMPGFGKLHQERMKRYCYYGSMEVAIRDEPVGELKLSSKNRLVIQKNLTSYDKQKLKFGQDKVNALFSSVGAQEVIRCHQAFGLHLMGGCALGTNAKTSVVSPDFTVHGFPNLAIADSSVFPSAPGINPSFTIMALSLKASEELSKR